MNDIQNLFIKRNNNDLAWSRMDDIVMMIMQVDEKDKVFKLNKTAAYLWEGFDGKTPLRDIIEKLSAQFDSDRQTILRDAGALIQSMEKSKLITLSSEPF